MAVWSVVEFKDIDLRDRFDAEYFQPEFLKIATALEGKGKALRDLGKLTCSAFYPAATHLYEAGTVPFIRCVDVISHPVIDVDQPFERIPPEFISENKSVRIVSPEDVVITKVGTPCYAGVVDESLKHAALTRTVLGVVNLDQSLIDPYYLVAFLRSDYGFYQLMREREQQIQLQLTLERVGRINVFLPDLVTQRHIGDIVRHYYDLLKQSKSLYAQAEALLLHELGLDTLDLSHQTTFTAPFAEVMEARRLDAEYFQPKYRRVLEALKALGPLEIVPLRTLLTTITNGHTPRHHDLSVGSVRFLTAEHVYDFRINFDTEKRILQKHHEGELNRTRLQSGDMLVTIKGRVGNTAIVDTVSEPTNINQDVALLRLKPDIPPYYVAGFLNCLAGKLFVEQISTSQINPFLGLGNLGQIHIPIFEKHRMQAWGDQIQQTLRTAYETMLESTQLLEQAKQRVEELILGEEM
jgi:restriction endonuclease S subunit